MQRKQLKRTLDSLQLELVSATNGTGNAVNLVVMAPDGATGKFQVTRLDDPHSDKTNINQLRHFAREHGFSHVLPTILEIDVLNITPKQPSDMEAACTAVTAEHDPETKRYAERVYRNKPVVINPVGRLLSGASMPIEPEPAPVIPPPKPKTMPKPVLHLTKPEMTTDKQPTVRKSPKTIDRIGQVEFFKLCTVLNDLDMVGVDSYVKLAAKLTKAYGRKISTSTAEDAIKATGKKLDKVQVEVTDAQAVIARTLTALLIKLSEPVPEELRRLCGEIE